MEIESSHRSQMSPHSSSNSSILASERIYKSSAPKDHEDSNSNQDRSSADIHSECLVESENPSIVHGHILPSGWTCNYDPETDQYKFSLLEGDTHVSSSPIVKEEGNQTEDGLVKRPSTLAAGLCRPTLDLIECQYGYHFPSSPTPSMISELAKQVQKSATMPAQKLRQVGYGKTKLTMLSDEEEQAKRLKDMFPTATGPVVEQMIRIYHGREGLIKAALISLGYKRATEYNSQQATAQSPIMLMMSKPSSKKLFDKLVSYFPDKDEALIKGLMYKHREVEHEIISVLVESGQSHDDIDQLLSKDKVDRIKMDRNGAIMKLRYLKFLFPTCDEIELYHLLHCNNLNAQKVIEKVEKKGHKMANIEEVIQNRKTQAQQMRAQQAALAAREKALIPNPIDVHKGRTKPIMNESRANDLKDNLKKIFNTYPDGVLYAALDASDYNEPLARRFLERMGPIDDRLYKQHYEIKREEEPQVVLFPCKGTQKSETSFMSTTVNEELAIAKEVIECDNALSLLKVDASTYTRDDFIVQRFTRARGRRPNLAAGSIFQDLEVKDSLRRGPMSSRRSGTHYGEICADKTRSPPNLKAKGRNKTLTFGNKPTLKCGHNPKLVQRVHPFFEISKELPI